MTSDLLRVSEVAERLGQRQETIRRKCGAGEIPCIRLGAGPRAPIRVRLDELEQWLDEPLQPDSEEES